MSIAISPYKKTALIVGFSREEHSTAEEVLKALDGYEEFIYVKDGREASRTLQGSRPIHFIQMNLLVVSGREEAYLRALLPAKQQLEGFKARLRTSDKDEDKTLLARLETPDGQTSALKLIMEDNAKIKESSTST